jgi:dTDP-4-amino-4,6-dideoxygalactose transaminase
MLRVPAAAVHFLDEDRAWVLDQIDQVLRSGRLTLGPYTEALEEGFARLCDSRYAVATSSGTGALEIVLRCLGVEGREVIVPTNTFYATAAAALRAGARVRFVDCDPETFAMDVDSLRAALGPRTGAVILVHIGGIITPRVHEIVALCRAAGVPLVEDAAHAHGSTLDGQPAGSFGIAAAFSLYATKVITSGEGGVIVTNDEAVYRDALVYRDQGKERPESNRHIRHGYNWRLSEVQAVIGLAQLRRLPEFIARRRRLALIYDVGLAGLSPHVRPLPMPRGAASNYYKYIAWLSGVTRDSWKDKLRREFGVAHSGEVYELPCHLQPVFADMSPGPLPKAEALCASHICLPISAAMTHLEAHYVLSALALSLGELVGKGNSGGGLECS